MEILYPVWPRRRSRKHQSLKKILSDEKGYKKKIHLTSAISKRHVQHHIVFLLAFFDWNQDLAENGLIFIYTLLRIYT